MSNRTRVKFCGMTRYEDARYAAELGVDALGFVFYEPSPRFIVPDKAADIIGRLPPFLTTVGLFVDATPEDVAETVMQTGIDCVQFHGDESPRLCAESPRPYIKAVRMAAGIDVHAVLASYSTARAILLDSFESGRVGGTGKTFDWSRIPTRVSKPIVLAGGLEPGNVARAIKAVQPAAVDVSSGIEARAGIKDHDKMRKFMQELAHHGA